ncbi:MAG: phosphoribosylglycinamide formyltransferase [Bacteroidales bacterium]|nr:phosphoribosylglycinamide formyltransferase [Bacteroidales bacterium]HOY38150.1 phosphoribosylglycinamide formyltransferase [Bacteroidales bacterium]HQP03048.1 phosphoribosylglycinamide formyltransferase [Bacteroidales bacterium]
MKKIAIFASGTGSNALNIIGYFRQNPTISVTDLLCNKKDAPVIEKAKNAGVRTFLFGKEEFYNSDVVYDYLVGHNIDVIVLAGFLWLVPEKIVNAFPYRILNIHPALLPAFGGKGMYGSKVHAAVLKSGDPESGITIHFVNVHYDAGSIIHQSKCSVNDTDTPESLAAKVHELEHRYYPGVIEQVALGLLP